MFWVFEETTLNVRFPLSTQNKSFDRKYCLQNIVKPVLSDRLLLNAGQKYCRMLQGEHSAILSTFIKLTFEIKIFVLPIFEWSLQTSFNALCFYGYIVHND